VQATVRSFSRETRSGDVLLDDGTLLPFGAEAFARSGLRLLRLGQRVRIIVEGDGPERRVVFLTLATF
jgi:2-phospho-L-lactate guanylyltransferase